MSVSKKQINKSMKRGMSPLDVCRMKQIAENAAKNMEREAEEKAFINMLAVTTSVLAFSFWPKSANAKVKRFLKETLNLYQSIGADNIKREECIAILNKYAGEDVEELIREMRGGVDENTIR